MLRALSTMPNEAAVCFILVSLVNIVLVASQQSLTEDSSELTTMIPLETGNSSLGILSRKRRYVVFPQGSSFQCACKIATTLTTPLTRRFAFGINLGLAWELPIEAHQIYLQKRNVESTRAALAQDGYGVLHRVDMFRVVELLLSVKGLKGRDCVMRAVCEASEVRERNMPLEQHRGNFLEELHKIVFALPFHRVHKTDYDEARDQAGNCRTVFSGCDSILDLEL